MERAEKRGKNTEREETEVDIGEFVVISNMWGTLEGRNNPEQEKNTNNNKTQTQRRAVTPLSHRFIL